MIRSSLRPGHHALDSVPERSPSATTLDKGAQASISNIGTVEATRQAVASTFYPPKGEREMGGAHRFRRCPARRTRLVGQRGVPRFR